MATSYDPNTNTTYTTTPPPAKRNTWAWLAAAVVVLALIVVFALPTNDRSGTDATSGTPPATMDTAPTSSVPAVAPPVANVPPNPN